ncbi:MAG: ester cyclase [Acidimicrobiia bacterium]
MDNQNVAVVLRYYEAFNTRDYAIYTELFAPDAEKLVPGMPQPEKVGIEGMVAFDRAFAEGFSDARIDCLVTIGSGDHVMSENRFTGTHDGTFHTPMGDAPATGNHADSRYVGTFLVRDGRIVSHHTYFDQAEMAAGVGLAPPLPSL